MNNRKISRRELTRAGVGVLTATALASMPEGSRAQGAGSEAIRDHDSLLAAGLEKAYTFLQSMMEAYAEGPTLRLIQSYSDQMQLESTTFDYDNAVVINAQLEHNEDTKQQRTQQQRDAQQNAQQNETSGDGR